MEASASQVKIVMTIGLRGAGVGPPPSGGRGKRGGVRVIYLYLRASEQVYLLSVYAKSQKDNLSGNEKKLIAGYIDAIQRDQGQPRRPS